MFDATANPASMSTTAWSKPPEKDSSMSLRLSVLISLLALFAAGCGQTRSIAVTGLVFDLSGAPVQGVSITAIGDGARSEGAVSGADGRFELIVDRDRSGVVLPVSGVYVDPVLVRADRGDLLGFSAAPALSTAQRAHGPALVILLEQDSVIAETECVASVQSQSYALSLARLLAPPPDWLAAMRDSGATAGLYDQMRAEIGGASRRCSLTEEVWRPAYAAIDSALDPYGPD